jgi:hypothetical protein
VDIAKVLNVSIESLLPKQISTSIDDVINKKADSPQTQELIRKIHDMADWD